MSLQRNAHARDNFIGRNILFAVIDKKRLECDGAVTAWALKIDRSFKRNQGRREIANGRAVGDIAANCRLRPDLAGTEAVQQRTQIRCEL